jgi:hypothetical protein
MGIVQMSLRPADQPVNQFRPADQSDATRRRMPFKKFLISEPLDKDGFWHGNGLCLKEDQAKFNLTHENVVRLI